MTVADVRAQAVQDVHDMLLEKFGYPKLSPLMQAIRDYRDAEGCCDGRLGDDCRCDCHISAEPTTGKAGAGDAR